MDCAYSAEIFLKCFEQNNAVKNIKIDSKTPTKIALVEKIIKFLC